MMTGKNKTPDGIASASKSKKSKEHLTTTTDQGKIELTEDELGEVTGGVVKAGWNLTGNRKV
jgi:hypothetical protein